MGQWIQQLGGMYDRCARQNKYIKFRQELSAHGMSTLTPAYLFILFSFRLGVFKVETVSL